MTCYNDFIRENGWGTVTPKTLDLYVQSKKSLDPHFTKFCPILLDPEFLGVLGGYSLNLSNEPLKMRMEFFGGELKSAEISLHNFGPGNISLWKLNVLVIGDGPKIPITKSSQHWPQHVTYCWWFRNPAITTWDDAKNLVYNGKNYQPPLVTTRFLNHQQYPQLPIFNGLSAHHGRKPSHTQRFHPWRARCFVYLRNCCGGGWNKHPGWLTSRNVGRMVGELWNDHMFFSA